MKFLRSQKNPILLPNAEIEWEAFATFNGSVVKQGKNHFMLYRAISRMRKFSGQELRVSSIGGATSLDGETFDHRYLFLRPSFSWNRFGCEDPRVTELEGRYYTFYTAISEYPFTPMGIKSAVAISDDLYSAKVHHLVTPFNAKAATLFPEKIQGHYWLMLTVDTDQPPSLIALAQFKNIEDIWNSEMWQKWYADKKQHALNLQRLNTDQVEIGAPPIKTPQGWLVIYSHIQNYYSDQRIFGVEAVLLDIENPRRIIARTQGPLLLPEAPYETFGTVNNIVFPTSAVLENNMVHLYYGGADTVCARATCSLEDLLSALKPNREELPRVHRPANNPILFPLWDHPWEQSNVFNPAAFYADQKFHIVYRAQGENGTSTLGYAISKDGLEIDERLNEPIYLPRMDFEIKKHEMGNSGCEDPRIIPMGDQLVMFYTAYDGEREPRVAVTRISLKDFLHRNWQMWELPKIISAPGVMDKNACVFPEKINGKYVFLHRIDPEILFDFRDDFAFPESDPWLKNMGSIAPRKDSWDSLKIGISAPPLKTKQGWLLLYHGVSNFDRHYRVGAMLLDLKTPQKVLARSAEPILQPQENWELKGFVNNVVFPCGAVIQDEKIYLYYGGADTVVGVALIGLSDLLDYLQSPRCLS